MNEPVPAFSANPITPRRYAALLDGTFKFIVIAAVLAILIALVGYPLFLLCRFSFIDATGKFSIATIIALSHQPGLIAATINSILLAIYVPIGCLMVGLPLAFLVARTNMPGKAILHAAAGLTFVIPSFITVIAWIFLAAPNSGQLNKLLRIAFDLPRPLFNIFSFSGLVFVEVTHLFPLVFFSVVAALSNMDVGYEQAARVLGAGRIRVALNITLPLVMPAIVSSAVLCMLDAISSFGAPATIGETANFSVLTVKIYTLMTQPPRLELAAAAALPIIAFTMICLFVQRQYLKRNRFTTIGGKTTASQFIDLGPWRWPALVICIVLAFGTVILPLLSLIVISLLKNFGAAISLENLELTHYRIFFDDSFPLMTALKNSFVLSIGAATIGIGLGFVYAWLVERSLLPGRGAITAAIMITYGIPPIALGLGIILGYVNLLYGTLMILLIGYLAKELPIAFVILRNGIKQISPDMEEAARIVGAGWLRCICGITVPLLKAGFWAAWLLVFSLCLRELALSVVLVQPGTEVMAVSVLNLLEDGSIETAAAVAVVISAASLIGVSLARALSDRNAAEM